jgi:hypothetical protein
LQFKWRMMWLWLMCRLTRQTDMCNWCVGVCFMTVIVVVQMCIFRRLILRWLLCFVMMTSSCSMLYMMSFVRVCCDAVTWLLDLSRIVIVARGWSRVIILMQNCDCCCEFWTVNEYCVDVNSQRWFWKILWWLWMLWLWTNDVSVVIHSWDKNVIWLCDL